MDTDNQARHDDPQFVKVLETCLKMEIATAEEKFEANVAKMRKLKAIMRAELDKRKELKEKTTQMKRIRVILNESLTSLRATISETSHTLEIVRANADDQYKLIQLRSQEYQGVIGEYKETWLAYHATYEEFPLARARNAAKVDLSKLQIAHMVMTYKKAEVEAIGERKRRIDWIRTRRKIIEFAGAMVERLRLKRSSSELKTSVEHHRRELRSIEMEMQVQRKREEDQRRLRKQKMLEMAPPKINIPYRQLYMQNQHARVHQQLARHIHEPCDDTISVNTVALEELCINENTAASFEEMEVDEPVRAVDSKRAPAAQTDVPDLRSPFVLEKAGAQTASVIPNVEMSAEEAISADDGDAETAEVRREETQKPPRESAETRETSCRARENLLKHSVPDSTPDEVEPKRIRLQTTETVRERRSESNNDGTTVLPSTVENVTPARKSPPSEPQVRKIETVHYDIRSFMQTPGPSGRASFAASNVPSPRHYEFCDSNISSIDHDFMSRAPSSLYEGSLCNYKLSQNMDISPVCDDEDAQMPDSMKFAPRQSDKDRSDDKASSFQFSDFMKRPKEAKASNFTLF